MPRMSSLEPTANTESLSPVDAADFIDSAAAGKAALRGSLLRGGAYAGTMLLSLISAPLLLRHLGLAGFGRYTTVIAIVTIVGGMTDAGLVTIAVREWASRRCDERDKVMGVLLGIRIELSALAVLIGVGFAIVAGYDHVLVLGTLLAGIGMMEQVCADLLTAPLQGELRFGWASVIDLSRQSTLVLAIVALVLAGAGLQPFFAVSILSGGMSLVLAAGLARRRMSLRPTWRGTERWAILRDTLPYSAAAAVNTFYFQLTIIAMSLIATAVQTGYFATSFRITQVLVAVPGLAIGAAFPILSRAAQNDPERFRSVSQRMLQLSLMAGTALVLGVVLIAPVAVKLIATDRGAPAIPVLQIQALALLATFPSVVAGYSLLALRQNRAVLIANVIALLANLTLTLILVPIAHAQGAAIAAATAEWMLGAGQLGFLWRSTGNRPPLRPALIVAAAGLIGAAPLLFSVSPVLRTVWGLAMYIAVLAIAGQLPPEIREALPSIPGRSRPSEVQSR
jgi:O-antigen/teichoic acid export membrane protein